MRATRPRGCPGSFERPRRFLEPPTCLAHLPEQQIICGHHAFHHAGGHVGIGFCQHLHRRDPQSPGLHGRVAVVARQSEPGFDVAIDLAGRPIARAVFGRTSQRLLDGDDGAFEPIAALPEDDHRVQQAERRRRLPFLRLRPRNELVDGVPGHRSPPRHRSSTLAAMRLEFAGSRAGGGDVLPADACRGTPSSRRRAAVPSSTVCARRRSSASATPFGSAPDRRAGPMA